MRQKRTKFTVGLIGIILAIIWLVPFYLMITNALKTKKNIFTDTLGLPETFQFSNFIEAFQELEFLQTFLNSVIITVASIIIIVIFSSMAAYALNRNKSKLSNAIFLIFVAAMLIPFQSVMIPLVTIFGKADMLNTIGLIFMYLGFGSSLAIFLYHGALKSVPTALDEAATIDGCNKFQTFWYIIFPQLMPISVTVAILNVIWIWNDYLLPSLVIGGGESETIPLRLFLFFGEYTTQWHLALAGLSISIVPVIIGYFFAQKRIIEGVSEGAVK